VWIGRWDGSKAAPAVKESWEHAQPTWGPGQRSWAWAPDGHSVAACRNEDGFGRLVTLPLGRGKAREVASGWHVALDWGTRGLLAVRSAPDLPDEVVVVDPGGPAHRRYARGAVGGFEDAHLPMPEVVSWSGSAKGPAKGQVHGLLWRAEAGGGERPPLLVMVHGGPTGQATASFNARIAFFCNRGWNVLTPNYRGSTGYGRDYAQALRGQWGALDVSDVADGIRHAVAKGWGDPDRVAVTGGSAGGFTTLLVCALHGDLVAAGVDLFGVADLFHLLDVTHRFEARYLDHIVGVLPQDADRYRDRSPVTHAERIRVPLLVLQGDEDVAVPKSQADLLVEALQRSGVEVEYQVYEGEGHGWSNPETIEDELTRTAAFLDRHVLRR